MKSADRTAFIISDPGRIAEILERKPAVFRIFLGGDHSVGHAEVTSLKGLSFHDASVRICQEMLQRRLTRIVSDQASRTMEGKVSELIAGSIEFALGGAVPSALENLWRNLPCLPGSRSVDLLRGRLRNIPGIIVASGPSLEKNAHLLGGLRDRAALISCGSTLGPLYRRGITPHFEIVVDPYPAMYDVLKPYLGAHACYVLSLMAEHRIAGECSGERMFFQVNFGPKVIEDIGRHCRIQTVLPAMASVATTALFFALHAGCDPIIFVGLDLCYSEDRTRVDAHETLDGICFLETPDGRRLPTSSAMKEAFDFYSDFIPTITNHKIVNATEGGAGVRGAQHIALAEAAARYMTEAVAFPELPALEVSGGQCTARLKELRDSFSSMYVKTAGFHRKVRAQVESGLDKAKAGAKIVSWFESLRAMPGYEYLAACLDWAWYNADTTAKLEPKLELLETALAMLQRQIPLLEKSVRSQLPETS